MQTKIKVGIFKDYRMMLTIYNEKRTSLLNIRVKAGGTVVLTPRKTEYFINPIEAVKFMIQYEEERRRIYK